MALALFKVRPIYLEYLREYFYQRLDFKVDIPPFNQGIAEFAIGYCSARPIQEKYHQLSSHEGIAHITEPEFMESLDWMDRGISRMLNHRNSTGKREALICCNALGGFAAFLVHAGEYETALRFLDLYIDFAKSNLPHMLDNETRDKLNALHAICLAYTGRYDEAIHAYPSKAILGAIIDSQGRPGNTGGMVDLLPYVLFIKENALDPTGRCGEEDRDFANRWLSDFYLSTSSYAAAMNICQEDIFTNKIGRKKNRHAVSAYLHFAICANHFHLWEDAQKALSTSLQIAQNALNPRVNSNANLYYEIFSFYFQTYIFQPDLKEAEFILDRAFDFLNDRSAMRKGETHEDSIASFVDCNAREQFLLCKAVLFAKQGKSVEALKFSQQVVDEHRKRREANPEYYKGIFDEFYMEAISVNLYNMLFVEQHRSTRSDEQILDVMQENIHIIDELKLVTMNEMRGNSMLDVKIWGDLVFSYWLQFPDCTVSTALSLIQKILTPISVICRIGSYIAGAFLERTSLRNVGTFGETIKK